MNRPIIALFFLFFTATASYAKVVAERADLGVRRPGQQAEVHIVLSNDAEQPVTVLRATSPPAPLQMNVRGLPLIVPAHGSAVADVNVNVGRILGKQTYLLEMDVDSDQKQLIGSFGVFVDSAIVGEPRKIEFGPVSSGQQAEKVVDLESRDFPELRARLVKDDAKIVILEITNDGKAIIVRTKKDLPWGIHEGWIEVTTNSTEQPTAWIEYRFETRGRVVPETYELGAGIQRVGAITPQTLFVRDAEGALLHFGKITHTGVDIQIKEIDCPIQSDSCRGLRVTLGKNVPTGKFSSVLNIDLPQYKQNLAVAYGGFLIAAQTNIKDLSRGVGTTNNDEQTSVASALKNATNEKASSIVMPVPAGSGPLLSWTVQNEQQLYGYIVYRADSEDGSMRRVSDNILRTLSTQDGVHVEYYWRDTKAEPGHTYWYQIGTVNQRDIRGDLTGKVKKTYTPESATAK